jgi:hypothetical protein
LVAGDVRQRSRQGSRVLFQSGHDPQGLASGLLIEALSADSARPYADFDRFRPRAGTPGQVPLIPEILGSKSRRAGNSQLQPR